jgi:hypothetical protein
MPLCRYLAPIWTTGEGLASGAGPCDTIDMADRPIQRLLPFDRGVVETLTPAPSVRYEPSDDALAAFERLEEWLLDARGRPVSQIAEVALFALARALLEGKNDYWPGAEDRLESLLACLLSLPRRGSGLRMAPIAACAFPDPTTGPSPSCRFSR